MRWDTGSGRMTTVATGNGAVRRIHFAPPPSPELAFSPVGRAELVARVSVLFASGLFGVWELDARSELRPVREICRCTAQRGWNLRLKGRKLSLKMPSGAVPADADGSSAGDQML